MEALANQLRGKVVFAYMPEHMRGKVGVRIDRTKDNVMYVAPSEGSSLTNQELHDLVADHISQNHPRKISVSTRESSIDAGHSQHLQLEPEFKAQVRKRFFRLSSTSNEGDALLEELAAHLKS